MIDLKTYFECGDGCTTPANTMGMGNPGQVDADTLTEPIGGVEKTAKALKQNDRKKKKKFKSLSESLFDTDIISKDMTFGGIFKLEDIETRDSLHRPSHGQMVKTNSKPENMYKIRLISKDSGQRVSKDLRSIADALAVIVGEIPITTDTINLSLYDFSQIYLKPLKQYYSSAVGNGYLRMGTDIFAYAPNQNMSDKLMDMDEVDIHFLNIKLHYKRV